MKTFTHLILAFLLLAVSALAKPHFPIPDESLQAVVVLGPDWNTPTAKMWRFERTSAAHQWVKVGQVVPVNLGRNGLAWGSGPLIDPKSVTSLEGPKKKEGDGRAPAGLFSILRAFGHPKQPSGYSQTNLPFLVVDDEQCVDDAASEHYNTVVDPSQTGGVTWKSSETMKIDLYRMGLVIGHNCPDAKPGLGSCIFFHLQRGPNDPTSGCTSMDTGSLTSLLLWLKKDSRPVLLQLPRGQYEGLADKSWPAKP